jgi:hypothetical protein
MDTEIRNDRKKQDQYVLRSGDVDTNPMCSKQISLLYSIFCALIRGTKYIKDQQMNFKFTYVLFLSWWWTTRNSVAHHPDYKIAQQSGS